MRAVIPGSIRLCVRGNPGKVQVGGQREAGEWVEASICERAPARDRSPVAARHTVLHLPNNSRAQPPLRHALRSGTDRAPGRDRSPVAARRTVLHPPKTPARSCHSTRCGRGPTALRAATGPRSQHVALSFSPRRTLARNSHSRRCGRRPTALRAATGPRSQRVAPSFNPRRTPARNSHATRCGRRPTALRAATGPRSQRVALSFTSRITPARSPPFRPLRSGTDRAPGRDRSPVAARHTVLQPPKNSRAQPPISARCGRGPTARRQRCNAP